MPMFSCKNISRGLGRNGRNDRNVKKQQRGQTKSANPHRVGRPSLREPRPSSHRHGGPSGHQPSLHLCLLVNCIFLLTAVGWSAFVSFFPCINLTLPAPTWKVLKASFPHCKFSVLFHLLKSINHVLASCHSWIFHLFHLLGAVLFL